MDIGENIRSLRKEKGMTQKELSKKSGIPETSIRKYENNQRQPKQKAIYQLSKALKVNPAWLMGYDVPMESLDFGKELNEKIKSFEKLIAFLESIGYILRFEKDILEFHNEVMVQDGEIIGQGQVADKETYSVTITKDKISTTMTEVEFEEFQETIERSVEFEIFKASQK